MKALFIRRLYIWPRWESQVKDVLGNNDQEIEVSSSASTASSFGQIWLHWRPAWLLHCHDDPPDLHAAADAYALT